MRNSFLLTIALAWLLAANSVAQQKHAASGMLLKIDAVKKTIIVSCREIPGYMPAMEMPIFMMAERTSRIASLCLRMPPPIRSKGEWNLRGQVSDPAKKWAIDPTVFENRGKKYLVWSGWEGDLNGTQNLYIARLKNPWTVEGHRVLLSTPQYEWEDHGDLDPMKSPDDPPHVNVNEGPEVLQHNGKLFLIYSASGCWADDYELGMLTASADSDLLDPHSWTKSPTPVFRGSAEAGVYAPGHNSFFHTGDGRDWILYHANAAPHQGCGNHRSPRAQPFTWNPDGSPNFGSPASTAIRFAWPKPPEYLHSHSWSLLGSNVTKKSPNLNCSTYVALLTS